MPGTLTITTPKASRQAIREMEFAWTCDASGDMSGVPSGQVNGLIRGFVTNPTDGPTANYDITLLDKDGVDVLDGAGVDRHTTDSEGQMEREVDGVTSSVHFVPINGVLNLVVAAAGVSKSGIFRLYIEGSVPDRE